MCEDAEDAEDAEDDVDRGHMKENENKGCAVSKSNPSQSLFWFLHLLPTIAPN